MRWYPYKMIRRHNLKDGDHERPSRFYQWFLHQCNNRRFLANFVVGNEARFALNGALNNHNVRMHAPANQSLYFHYKVNAMVNDSRQKLIVWVRLCGNSDMLNVFFFDGNVNGQSYINLLNDKIIRLMAVLFQNQFHENRFQRLRGVQDGAPYIGLLAVRAIVNQLFGEKVLRS